MANNSATNRSDIGFGGYVVFFSRNRHCRLLLCRCLASSPMFERSTHRASPQTYEVVPLTNQRCRILSEHAYATVSDRSFAPVFAPAVARTRRPRPTGSFDPGTPDRLSARPLANRPNICNTSAPNCRLRSEHTHGTLASRVFRRRPGAMCGLCFPYFSARTETLVFGYLSDASGFPRFPGLCHLHDFARHARHVGSERYAERPDSIERAPSWIKAQLAGVRVACPRISASSSPTFANLIAKTRSARRETAVSVCVCLCVQQV